METQKTEELMRTAIVILNWNGLDLLKKFLGFVIQRSKGLGDIYIADNGSEDDSLKWLKEKHPEIRIIDNGSNLGFAGGYNEALKHIDAELFILLNSDIEVGENWLKPLIDKFAADDAIVACQPKILSYSQKDHFEHAGAAGGYIDKYGYPFCKGRVFSFVESDNGQYNESSDIFWASGACMAIRSETWYKMGGLDPDFFAHMEEIDLCWRIRSNGLRIVSAPESVVYHIGGGTLPYSSPTKVYYNFRNSLFMLHKNLPSKGFKRAIIKRLLLDGVAAMRFLLTFELKASLQVFRSHISYYANIKSLNSKRNNLIQKDLSEYGSLVLNKSIASNFYLKGKKTYRDLLD